MELLFLFCFSLHNLEEALWLPAWSKHAKKYHKEVAENEFRFAVIVVTILGYLITFQFMLFPMADVSRFIYCGFVLMMVANVFFPHIAATAVLRRYAPGAITGIFLNAPVGIYILAEKIKNTDDLTGAFISGVIISVVVLSSLKYLFIAGGKLIR